MNIEELLEEKEHYKISILRLLEIEKNNFILYSKVREITGLTKFKFTVYFKELTEELQLVTGINQIILMDDGEILCEKLNLEVIKQMRLHYFKSAPKFKILTDLLVNEQSVDTFSDNNHLSSSNVYVKRRELKAFLKKNGIKIKKNQLIGDEQNIRTKLFCIYFEIYNGMFFPFSAATEKSVNQLTQYALHWFNLKLSHTEYVKLQLFLGIMTVRYQNKHSINADYLTDYDIDQSLLNIFSATAFPNQNQFLKEIGTFILYLYLCVPASFRGQNKLVEKIDTDRFFKVDGESKKIVKAIFDSLLLPNLGEAKATEVNQVLLEKIVQTNRRYFLFHFHPFVFRSKKQINFFTETYPEIARTIKVIIEERFSQLPFDESINQAQLFYDYLFLLFDSCDISTLEKPVYVCVDFSLGEQYSHYISSQIKGFKNFNIILEDRFSSRTDLFLSDCLINKIGVEQIIWKNPPSSDDWEDFGNKIIHIKRKKIV
ncbi:MULTISPECIES: helix-turn-helix domain-containing protein [Enterococcus]|uniref:helix-turn-helix domain-containing protein n=1 Tax=Enterococcus TaxID=1350 RepID=UPI002648D1CD|nr:helix-turn-helix domain-containing protein [Enterococcus entomosocium]